MTQAKPSQSRQPGHVAGPAVFIGALSLLLVAGLEMTGLLDRLHVQVDAVLLGDKSDAYAHDLPVWLLWVATALFASGLSAAMLGSPRQWRRALLWLVSLVLVASWAPVLMLAAYAPHIAGPWIAVFWAGACCLVYASNHQMDGDPEPNDLT